MKVYTVLILIVGVGSELIEIFVYVMIYMDLSYNQFTPYPHN